MQWSELQNRDQNSSSKIQEKESESDQNKTTQINNQKQNASPDIIVQ